MVLDLEDDNTRLREDHQRLLDEREHLNPSAAPQRYQLGMRFRLTTVVRDARSSRPMLTDALSTG